MKRRITIFSLLFILLIGNSNAQWYKEEYWVSDINDLTEEQLRASWEKAEKKWNTGFISTFFGASAAIGGLVLVGSIEGADSFDEGIVRWSYGLILTVGGVVSTSIGISMMVSYSRRKSQIEGAANFSKSKYRSLNITPKFDYNHHINSYTSGLTITLNF